MQRIDLKGEITQDIVDAIEIIDNQVEIYIDSQGGYVSAGVSLYNKLRGYNVEYSTIIVRECSSIALLALMIAPIERRYAYRNSFGVIHDVRMSINDNDITADELESITYEALKDRNTIISIISDRTNQPTALIENLMITEKRLSFYELKELNFISNEKLLISNNNKKLNYTNMKKKFLNSLSEMFKNLSDEVEDEKEVIEKKGIEDGVYVTKGGDTITIEGGKVKFSDKDDETEKEPDGDADDKNCTTEKETVNEEETEEDLTEKVSGIEEGKEDLKGEIEALKEEIEALKAAQKSQFEVPTVNKSNEKAKVYSSSSVIEEIEKKLSLKK